MTEGAKRATPTPRTTLSSTTSARPPSTAATRPTRTAGSASISSIREVRDDSKALEELQSKVLHSSYPYMRCTNTVYSLMRLPLPLKLRHNSLRSWKARSPPCKRPSTKLWQMLKRRTLRLPSSRLRRRALRANWPKSRPLWSRLVLSAIAIAMCSNPCRSRSAHERLLRVCAVVDVSFQLAAAKASNESSAELIQNLKTQIETLEGEVQAAKENLEVLKATSGQTSEAAAEAAAIEHDALIKAKADLDTISTELASLKEEHAKALAEAQEKISALEASAAKSGELEAELAQLRTENEEKSNRVSELEIEILEMKEEQEKIQDEHSKTLERIKALEEELAQSATAMLEAVEAAKAKHEELSSSSDAAAQAHAEELSKASAEYEKLEGQLKSLQEELEKATAANDQAKAEALAAAEEQRARVEELEKEYQAKETSLSEEIQRLTTELEVWLSTTPYLSVNRTNTATSGSRGEVQCPGRSCEGGTPATPGGRFPSCEGRLLFVASRSSTYRACA